MAKTKKYKKIQTKWNIWDLVLFSTIIVGGYLIYRKSGITGFALSIADAIFYASITALIIKKVIDSSRTKGRFIK